MISHFCKQFKYSKHLKTEAAANAPDSVKGTRAQSLQFMTSGWKKHPNCAAAFEAFFPPDTAALRRVGLSLERIVRHSERAKNK